MNPQAQNGDKTGSSPDLSSSRGSDHLLGQFPGLGQDQALLLDHIQQCAGVSQAGLFALEVLVGSGPALGPVLLVLTPFTT